MIYFDNAATTKVDDQVITDIIEALKNDWTNPSSISTQSKIVKNKIEYARQQIATYINAEPEEIIFTASGSEANNLAITGFLEANPQYKTIITTELEHPSVYNTCLSLQRKGYNVDFVPVDTSGLVWHFSLVDLLSRDMKHFVSIMLANNEIGTVQNIKGLVEETHKYGGIIHTDATQAFGKILIDVKKINVDLMSVSLHKCGLPKGIGFLYKKKELLLSPIIHGGHQEMDYRAGTENTAYIIAAGKQIERMYKKEFPNHKLINYLFNDIYDALVKEKCNFFYNGALSSYNTLPNLLSFTLEDVDAEALITLLDLDSIHISTGSACCAGEKTPSRVLKAIGLTDKQASNTIRISISENTTTEECDEFIRGLLKNIKLLKRFS